MRALINAFVYYVVIQSIFYNASQPAKTEYISLRKTGIAKNHTKIKPNKYPLNVKISASQLNKSMNKSFRIYNKIIVINFDKFDMRLTNL